MRVMVIVKANHESENGVMPTEQELAEMTDFNEELLEAGIMLAGDGLHPSSKGVRIRFNDDDRSVIDGPFAETKELIAGFWIWKVDSMDHAISWARRIPFREGEVEIRPVFEDDDFGDEFTPELRQRENEMRKRMEGNV